MGEDTPLDECLDSPHFRNVMQHMEDSAYMSAPLSFFSPPFPPSLAPPCRYHVTPFRTSTDALQHALSCYSWLSTLLPVVSPWISDSKMVT